MSINKHDDYEKLAKILYPSIEASGNVYYGQTRKLTMDEILGKNNVNFESHIETVTTEESTDSHRDVIRKSYFCWKLGPLHDSFLCSTVTETFNDNISTSVTKHKLLNDDFGFSGDFLDSNDCHTIAFDGSELHGVNSNNTYYGTVFAKYKLNLDQITVENIINSGVYNSYENNVGCEFCYPVLTNNTDPSKPLAYNIYNISDRSFYIKYEDDEIYLYVQIATANMYDGESADKPLTIVSCEDNNTIIFKVGDCTEGQTYERNINNSKWESLRGEFHFYCNKGEFVSLRRSDAGPVCYCDVEIASTGTIAAYNNINSMIAKDFVNLDDFSDYDYEYSPFKWLFNNQIIFDGETLVSKLTKMPVLPSKVIPVAAYYSLFYKCDYLTDVSVLPALNVPSLAYQYMFFDCNRLERSPKIVASVYEEGAPAISASARGMFNSCNSLMYVQTNIRINNVGYESVATYEWLDGVSSSSDSTIICPSNAPLEPNSTSGIPTGWQKIAYDPDKDDDYENIVISVPHNGYNVRQHLAECNSDNSQCYKQYDYIVASGSDSNYNGRGYIVSNTKYNMNNPNNKSIDEVVPNTYNYEDGSYNQEIWGYKWFNSPVKFRNGIYGEQSSITTDRSEIHYENDTAIRVVIDEGSLWKSGHDSRYAYTGVYTGSDRVNSIVTDTYKARIGVKLDDYYIYEGSVGDQTLVDRGTVEGALEVIGEYYNVGKFKVDYKLSSVGYGVYGDNEVVSKTSISSAVGSAGVSIIKLSADKIDLDCKGLGGLPYPFYSNAQLKIPIGSLACIYLPIQSFGPFSDYTGATFTISEGTPEVRTVTFSAQGEPFSSPVNVLPDGKYVCIGGGQYNIAEKGWALVMRYE